jgi:hypothetical protein
MLTVAVCVAHACGGETGGAGLTEAGASGSAGSGFAGNGGSSGSSGGAAANTAIDASADSTILEDASPDRSSGGASSGGFGGTDAGDGGAPCVCDGSSYGPGEEGLKCFCAEFGCRLQIDDPLSSRGCNGGDIIVFGGPDCGRVTYAECFGTQVVSKVTYHLVSGELVFAGSSRDTDDYACGFVTTAGTLPASGCADAAPACSLCPSSCCRSLPACDKDAGVGGTPGAGGAGWCE